MRTMLSLLRTSYRGTSWRGLQTAIVLSCAAALIVNVATAQPPNNQFPNAIVPPFNGPGNQAVMAGPNANQQGPDGRLGGAANADFDSLIELITSTVSAESWVDG